MDELEHCHQEQQTGMQGELKKEIALLQKKVLMESVSQRSGGKVASFPVSLVQFSCRLQYVFDTVSSYVTRLATASNIYVAERLGIKLGRKRVHMTLYFQ